MSTLKVTKPFSDKEKSSNRKQSKQGACFTAKQPHKIKNQMSQLLSYFEAALVPFLLMTDTAENNSNFDCKILLGDLNMMKTFYAVSVMVATSILTSSAQAGQVEKAWDLFAQKCQQFLDNPAEFLDRPDRNIPNWEWIIREEANTGFFEYFSVSPGEKMQFTAIRHAGVDNDFLHCSISVASGRSGLSETISRHLSTLPDVQQVGGVIDFPNETGMSNDLKRYYSTAYRTSLAGVFDSQNVSTQVRVDDLGGFYFEVHAVRPAE